MTHFVVGAWIVDGKPSGARTRLRELLRAVVPQLESHERLTVLHTRMGRPFDLDERVEWHPVEILPIPTWQRAIAERLRLRTTLREIGADIVELGALPVPPRLPCPVSLTIHDLRDLDGERRRKLPLPAVRAIVRRSVRRAARVTVPSEFTASRVRRHAPGTEIRVVPNGVHVQVFPNHAPSTPPFILHVGHLEPRKNLGVLIDAVSGLDRSVRLVLVGLDHGARDELVTRARAAEVEDRVEFRDVVPTLDLRDLYARAAVIAVPSRYEGFGFAALEGLAAGRPVVVGSGSALSEVVGVFGRTVDTGDVSGWTAALQHAMQNDDPAAVSARRAHARTFSWQHAASLTLANWRELAAQNPLSTRAPIADTVSR